MIKNKRHITTLVLLIIFAVLLSHEAFTQNRWLTYRNNDYKFRFLYPSDWQIGTPRGSNIQASLFSPAGSPMANCNLLVLSIPEFKSKSQNDLNHNIQSNPLKENDWVNMLVNKWPDVKVLETSITKVDNQPAYIAFIEYSNKTVDRKRYIHGSILSTFTRGYMWQFTCGGKGIDMASARHSSKSWHSTFQRIMGSLVFETWQN